MATESTSLHCSYKLYFGRFQYFPVLLRAHPYRHYSVGTQLIIFYYKLMEVVQRKIMLIIRRRMALKTNFDVHIFKRKS